MDTVTFDRLLLKTAFCCMACDGHIDKKEIELIKSLFDQSSFSTELNFESDINDLVTKINNEGKEFIKRYLTLLNNADLTEKEEETIIEFAIKTIHADDKVEYAEVKFLKVIQSHLSISKEKIISLFPDIEYYLEDDIIKDNYLEKLVNQYFDTVELPIFEHLEKI